MKIHVWFSMAICLLLNGCAYSPVIPQGAIHSHEKLFRSKPPEARFDKVVFWFQSATNRKGKKVDGVVIIDFIRVIKQVDDKEVVVYEKRGDELITSAEGGLFIRNPQWFLSDSHGPIENIKIDGGKMLIDVGSTPDNIVHWWTDRIPYNSSSTYVMKARLKISGDVGFQYGIDFWNGLGHNGWSEDCSGKNNCEAYVSDWINSQWRYMTIEHKLTP